MPELWAYELERTGDVFVVFKEATYQFRLVVARHGIDRSRKYDRGRMEFVINPNRLLVTEHDSHITEERRIEEKMIEIQDSLIREYESQSELIDVGQWHKLIASTRAIESGCQQQYILQARLQDVRQINATFARIQGHIDRIEATEEKESD